MNDKIVRKICVLVMMMASCWSSANGIALEDFLGGRPLTKERIVNDILQYYQQTDPKGIPVLEIPEPLFIDKKVSTGLFDMDGINISGQSGLRLQYAKANITDLSTKVLIRVPRLEVLSQYEYVGYFTSTYGDMNLTIVDLEVATEAVFGADEQAKLSLENLNVDVTKEQFLPFFENPPTALSIAVSAADTFFGTIVNTATGSLTKSYQDKINDRLSEKLGAKRFPVGIRPVDLLVAELKSKFMGKFDPFNLGNRAVHLPAGFTLFVNNIQLEGLSTLHRTHEISVQFIDNRILLVVQIGTQEMSVEADLELSASLLPSVTTKVEFVLDSFNVWFEAHQAADVRNPPLLRRLHFELGNFHLSSSGESTFSYFLEAAVNILPNAFRNLITEKVEPVLHQTIQQRLNTLDIEQLIQNELKKM